MYCADQQLRKRAFDLGSGVDPRSESDFEVMRAMDERHAARMAEIIGTCGWPGILLVGEDGSNAAWLLVQHADHDVALQRRALALLERAVGGGEARPDHAAYLHDRVAVNGGFLQRYGTQGRCVEPGQWDPHDLEDPDRVDELRASVGLPTLNEYRLLMDGYCP
jgi:hypothetical protein